MSECSLENKVTGVLFISKKLDLSKADNLQNLSKGEVIYQTTKRGALIRFKLINGFIKHRYIKQFTNDFSKRTKDWEFGT